MWWNVPGVFITPQRIIDYWKTLGWHADLGFFSYDLHWCTLDIKIELLMSENLLANGYKYTRPTVKTLETIEDNWSESSHNTCLRDMKHKNLVSVTLSISSPSKIIRPRSSSLALLGDHTIKCVLLAFMDSLLAYNQSQTFPSSMLIFTI